MKWLKQKFLSFSTIVTICIYNDKLYTFYIHVITFCRETLHLRFILWEVEQVNKRKRLKDHYGLVKLTQWKYQECVSTKTHWDRNWLKAYFSDFSLFISLNGINF